MSESEAQGDNGEEKSGADEAKESSGQKGGEKKLVFRKPVSLTISIKAGGEEKKTAGEHDEKEAKEKDPEEQAAEGQDDGDDQKEKKKDEGLSVTIAIKDGGEGKESGGEEDKKKDADKKGKKKTPLYKKPVFIITAVVAGVVILVALIVIWLIVRQYVSTDDAYIDSHVVQVSPQIGARVLALRIADNQLVHKGDLLIQLDPTDYDVALLQAKAQVSAAEGKLAQAQAQVETARASVPEAVAKEESAQASLANTAKDLERYQKVDERARSRQQLDTAATAQTNAQAQVEQAHAQVVAAKANVVSAGAAVKAAEGELQEAEAGREKAEVNRSYCQITAPSEGRVTERTVEAGNYVTSGQALFLLVDPNVWVTANFKETQLTHMQPGQPVTIKVDAFPGTKFRGHVDSIQAGSGARFSVLPAENATGNYVKIVQRVPVKIIFEHDANTNNALMLSPGLSVVPRVKVR